jgi:pyruvate dehydrogenase E2 component (dihydrolipoamide acetyltransferase)
MPAIHPVTLPKWGLEMSEGTVSAWHLDEGAALEKGAEMVDIETDKIVNSLESDVAGVLRRILVAAGETAPVGALIAVVSDAGVPAAEIDAFIAGYKPIDASFEPGDAAPKTQAAVATPAPRSTPLARRVADAAGVDLAAVPGSGPGGRVRRDDVLAVTRVAPLSEVTNEVLTPEAARAANADIYASPIAQKFAAQIGLSLAGIAGSGRRGRVSLGDAQAAAQALRLWQPEPEPAAKPVAEAPAAGVLRPFGAMRKSIARALSHSKATVPHFYTSMDVETDALMTLRAQMNADSSPRISVNDFILRASALALAAHPDVNVHVSEAGVIPLARADIAMAVAIEGGLLTPVVRDVGAKGLRQIAQESADLALAARERRLDAAALDGAGFTVSNLGMFGVRDFSAIVAAPQAAILAVGGPRREAREAQAGVRFATVITLTLSADHRAVDGALAAQFLVTLRDLIEAPYRLIL